MSFWDNQLNGGNTPQQPTVSPYARQVPPTVPVNGQAPQQPQAPYGGYQQPRNEWWKVAPNLQEIPDVSQYVPGRDGPPIEELARMDASTLSQEALELVAAWKLKSNGKYDNTCPHCFAKNGMMRNESMPSVAPRCVECGYSSRAVHEQLQPVTHVGAGKPGDEIHARTVVPGSWGEKAQHHSAMRYQEMGGPGRS